MLSGEAVNTNCIVFDWGSNPRFTTLNVSTLTTTPLMQSTCEYKLCLIWLFKKWTTKKRLHIFKQKIDKQKEAACVYVKNG